MTRDSYQSIVGVHFSVGKKIGEGSFGVIFDGTNMLNHQPVAIKFEPRKTEAPQLRDEYRAYKTLRGCLGIPNVYYFGQEGLHLILVIDLLGPSLEDLFDWCGRKFTLKTTVQVAKQMISRVQTIHERSLIYRDIKPDNFLIGRQGTPTENLVYVVDFGMAKQYRDPISLQHIPYRERKSLSGTARYMSINTHLGREQSRRDDLEALGHVFMYFLRGGLPWQGLKAQNNKQKYERIGEKKRSTRASELCAGFPPQFAEYMTYVRNLRFEETPNYDYLRDLMTDALKSVGEQEDGEYDWMLLNDRKGYDSTNKKPNLHGYGHPNPPNQSRQHHNTAARRSKPSAPIGQSAGTDKAQKSGLTQTAALGAPLSAQSYQDSNQYASVGHPSQSGTSRAQQQPHGHQGQQQKPGVEATLGTDTSIARQNSGTIPSPSPLGTSKATAGQQQQQQQQQQQPSSAQDNQQRTEQQNREQQKAASKSKKKSCFSCCA